MLLSSDWVIRVSAPPIADAAVRVVDGVIAEVGPAAQLRARFPADEERAFPGCALLPGFVNCHTHLELSAFRGFTRASTFGSWMLALLRARRKLDPADYEAAALWGAYECARSGITSIADTAYDGAAVARAAAAAGLRARVYQEVFGLDDSSLPATLTRLEAAVRRLEKECGTLVEAGVSPHAPYTVSAALYREAARFARGAGLRLATHVAESPAEVELLDRGTGPIAAAYRRAEMWDEGAWTPPHARPLEHVASTGALGPDALVVHAVQASEAEIGTLASRGAAVAHCPRSNARLSCGAAPVTALLAAGVTVGLGTDSLASNDSLDMFAEMRAALRAAEERAAGEPSRPARVRAAAGAPQPPLTPEDVLRMATLGGAQALGWADRTGSLEAGKSADVIAVRLPDGDASSGRRLGPAGDAESPSGRHEIGNSLVASATAADVRMTMVAGRVVFEKGTRTFQAPSGFQTARQKLGLAPRGRRG